MKLLSPRTEFEFDLNGYVIFRQFLSNETVRQLNQIIDASPAAQSVPKFLFATLNPAFLDLMSRPEVLELCEAWMLPSFKFENAWGIQYPVGYTGKSHENLHGGPFENQGYFQYHWRAGHPFVSSMVFSYILEPQRPGDGGLALIPGSHKSNAALAGRDVQHGFLDGGMSADWIVQPELNAGDLLILTEAVIHGTQKWQPPDRRRRNLYYKYSLGCMSYYPAEDAETVKLRELARNETQRNLLRESYVADVRGQGGKTMQWRSRTRE